MKPLSESYAEPLSGKIKHVVLLLHGYGASGKDLISLSSFWQPYLPDTLFIAPNALDFWEGNIVQGQGYQWFPLPDLSPDTLLEGMESALPAFHRYMDKVLTRYHLQEEQLALVGFSQGAMMVLAVALSRSRTVAGVVAYSGALVYPETKPITSRPPVLLVHGDKDDVVPIFYLDISEKELRKRGVSVTPLICHNIGHEIDNRGLQAGGAFLRQQLMSSDPKIIRQSGGEK